MNKKELDEYCKSLGLVRQTNLNDMWYCYTYPFKYARPSDVIVGFQTTFEEFDGKKAIDETRERKIKATQRIVIGTESKCIACSGFSELDGSDEEIKQKIYKLVRQYEKVIGYYKRYRAKSKVKEIEGDFV